MTLKGGQKGQIQSRKGIERWLKWPKGDLKSRNWLPILFVIHLAIFDLLFGHCTHF